MSTMGWCIFCDFDGTIALEDVTDTLLERFAPPAWRELEQAWKAGTIGSRECLAQQIPLLDMSRAQLDRHLDTIELDPDFPGFVAEARASGHALVIVSDGLDYSIRRILARHRLVDLPIMANALQQTGDRAWRLGFPCFVEGCRAMSGHCKCASVRRWQGAASSPRTLLIGDGTSDFCAAHQVDLVFAKQALIGHCASKGLPHHPIRGFAEARRLLSILGRIDAPDIFDPVRPREDPEHLDHG